MGTGTRRLTLDEQRRKLESEPWFHGIVSRGEAEALVTNVMSLNLNSFQMVLTYREFFIDARMEISW